MRRRQSRLLGLLGRLVVLVVVGYATGGVLNLSAERLARRPEPAGFARGLVQGALMPCTLPGVWLGQDVELYSGRNSGLPYKRGYTLGVSLCGALFFGLLYRRLGLLRGRERPPSP